MTVHTRERSTPSGGRANTTETAPPLADSMPKRCADGPEPIARSQRCSTRGAASPRWLRRSRHTGKQALDVESSLARPSQPPAENSNDATLRVSVSRVQPHLRSARARLGETVDVPGVQRDGSGTADLAVRRRLREHEEVGPRVRPQTQSEDAARQSGRGS